MCDQLFNHVRLFVAPWTVAARTCQAPLSIGFFRQEYWSRLPFPSPGYLPDSLIETGSPAWQADSLLLSSEKAMATHSSTLAWKMPWKEEPGRLQSMESRRVGHKVRDFTFTFHFHAWRRKWQPTPMFLPGESQGWWSLLGCCLWGRTESDTTEAT